MLTRIGNIAMTRKRMAPARLSRFARRWIAASSRSNSKRGFRSSSARLCVGRHIMHVANRPHAGRYGGLALSAEAHRTVEAFIVRPAFTMPGQAGSAHVQRQRGPLADHPRVPN
jgi:hypothetical protein